MINFYKGRLCLNCLADGIDNAKDILDTMNGNALIGVLSSQYASVEEALSGIAEYQKNCEGNISLGLGAGDPKQWERVARIAARMEFKHINQIFSAVGFTRALGLSKDAVINGLVSPCGKPGFLKISTGPLSSLEADGIVPADTAIAMIREMGGNSVKYFPMKGLSQEFKNEFKALARACAKNKFILEPTGGINLANVEEILSCALDEGVEQVIVHVYTSIIHKESGKTNIEDVKKIDSIFRKLLG